MTKPTTVDAYLTGFDGETRQRLERLRALITTAAPEAQESIAYDMPAYKLNGKPLIYFAGYAKHIGLYATPSGHAAFAEELSHYKQGKGSVQFPLNQEMPWDSDRAHRRLQGRRVVRAITTKDWPRPPSARTTRLLEAEKLRRRVCTRA